MKRSWMLPTIATAQDGSRNPIATASWGTTVSRLGGCIWASFKNLNHRPEIVQSHNQHYSTSDPTPSSIFKRQLEQLRWMLLQHPATSWPFQLVLPTPGRQKELPHGISQNCGTHDDMSLSNRWRTHLFPPLSFRPHGSASRHHHHHEDWPNTKWQSRSCSSRFRVKLTSWHL